ncbi:uncharacterized protein SPEM2 [Dromiciops gliroides]|uniref:uncharacterized protein SPEM2 n=1 Tax=Dromiciops gliroides TaxID=33562 RepID=UPI001CC50D45|nr:uncharacterized protein SPEM2 [Dromiciops gliroides]
MAEQAQHGSQMHSGHRPARNLDTVDLILLLLTLIILLNLGINVMILIWSCLTRSFHRTCDFFQPKGKILKKPQPSIKKSTGVPTLCIHCTLDPVALNVAHPATNRHRCHRQHSGICHGSYWESQQGSRHSRRHHGRQRLLQYHHYPGTSIAPPPPPLPATSPTSFCHQETWDTDVEDNKEPWNQQSNYQQSWDPTCNPGNIRHYRGYWSSYYPSGPKPSPQDLRAPKRVEAKSELRLETYYQSSPNSWPQNLKENKEPGPIPTSPQLIHRFPPNPSWMPGTHNPLLPSGQIFYDWEVKQRIRDGNKGTDVPKTPQSGPRSPEPQSYAENVVPRQSVRRTTVPLISAHVSPLNRTHVSAGHLPFSSRDRPEIKRWNGEYGELLPPRTSIGSSPSFSRLPNQETQNHRGSAPNENLIPEVSQPLSYVSARVPVRVPAPDTGRAYAFIPLSRSPGGLTNYQVYDSQELKRQIQEGRGHRGEAFSCSPGTPRIGPSSSWHSLHRTKAGRLN